MEYIIVGVVVGVLFAIIMAIVQANGRKKFNQQVSANGFTATKRAGALCADENNKKWWVEHDGGSPIFHDYNEILDFELVVDGEKFKSKGGVSRAIAGGILFGGVGAIVGASTAKRQSTITKMYMTIILKGGNLERVSFIESETKVDSWIYNVAKESAEQADAILTNIMYEADNSAVDPVASVAHASTQIETTTNNSQAFETKNLRTQLVGVTYNNDKGVPIQSVLPQIQSGAFIELMRERENPFDSNAIKVLWNEERIGYIPTDIAATIAPLMDKGAKIVGRVEEITGDNASSYGCNISILVIE